jgi:hypothetical protein
MVDPLHVIETVMRYFYSLAQTGRKANAPLDEVRKYFEKAAQLAALAAPYRHPRLSAVKQIDHADEMDGISANATPEESVVRNLVHKRQICPSCLVAARGSQARQT